MDSLQKRERNKIMFAYLQLVYFKSSVLWLLNYKYSSLCLSILIKWYIIDIKGLEDMNKVYVSSCLISTD